MARLAESDLCPKRSAEIDAEGPIAAIESTIRSRRRSLYCTCCASTLSARVTRHCPAVWGHEKQCRYRGTHRTRHPNTQNIARCVPSALVLRSADLASSLTADRLRSSRRWINPNLLFLIWLYWPRRPAVRMLWALKSDAVVYGLEDKK